MTRIAVDPDELSATAGLVRTSAAEVADVGAALASCTCCAMPPDVESLVTQIVATADRILDLVAQRLNGAADDLLGRAGVATNDSLTAASAATGPALAPTEFIVGGGMSFSPVVTPAPLGGAVVGGTTPWTMTGPGIDSAVIGGASIVGGTAPWSMTGSDVSSLIGGSVVGGTSSWTLTTPLPSPLTGIVGGTPNYAAGPMGGVMALAEAAQASRERATARIDRILANPNSSQFAVNVALNASDGLNDSMRTITAPSRAELERSWGRPISLSEFHALNTGGFDGIVGGVTRNPVLEALGIG